ncbi:MAG: hydantoinase B/oxoprolinase family protein, partial [Cyanobacteria bacterium J06576_12]
LTPAKHFQGKDSILSGPAGGIVGAVQASRRAGFEQIITFDMGGTSTDVAHYKEAKEKEAEKKVREQKSSSPNYERAYETEVAGVRLRSPMMAIHTVAAGGGSILAFEGDRYRVGPESAGAYPGPACYRNGGPLSVTDCNVMVGKIQPQFFPQVFGEDGQQALDAAVVRAKFQQLAEQISRQTGDRRRAEQVAEGFLAIATDNMANAIKKISVQKGYDIGDYTLCCFGAAGGQHACRLAEALGMKTVFIHPYAGVLSAYGMGLADRRVMKEKTIERTLSYAIMDDLHREMFALSQAATAELKEQGEDDIDTLEVVQTLQVRYAGTDSTLTVDLGDLKDIQQDFEQRYQQQYGITLPNKGLVVSAIIAEAIGKTAAVQVKTSSAKNEAEAVDEAIATIPLFSADQWHQTPVFQRESIHPGAKLTGPAIILEKTGTNIIEPNWTATVNDEGALVLTYQPASEAITSKAINRTETDHSIYSKPDPVRLEIFNSLFQTIAEQMGFTLQNTSSSVNIKERLDFSCAIFDGQGQLVANAPHIPVHLGSMGESVQALIASQNSPFQPGNTYISNNPYNGGTHLPDVTAITPVFISIDSASGSDKENQPLFFVASRGHHADIGGSTPGSMPPNSTHLEQEGVLLDNFKLIDQGELRQEALRQHLATATYPVRNPDQNIADLQAQVAANNKGAQELHRMVQQFGLATVQAYMQHVQNNAEQAVE